MNLNQALPSEATDDGDLARQLLEILGPAYQAPDGSNNAADFLSLGGALADVRAVLRDALAEAFADTAWDLLSELETIYGLPVRTDLSQTDRQARLVAKIRAARAGSPQDIKRAVGAINPTVTVHENTPTIATTAGYPRGVFLFAVRLAVTVWNNPSLRAQIDALCRQMQPTHTNHSLHTNDPAVGFRCNDPNSLVGRDAVFTV